MRNTYRRPLAVMLLGSASLLAGCGMDPPPAPAGQQAAETPAAEAPVAKGLALVERSELAATAANGEGARCNIETMAGEALEATHPTLAAGHAVGVQGWYAAPAAQPASAPADAVPAADGASPATPAVTAAPARTMLVLANENGLKHWVVQLPELTQRKDVATALNDPTLTHTGFDVELDLSALAPGFYSIHLSDEAHSAASVCGVGRGFVIK